MQSNHKEVWKILCSTLKKYQQEGWEGVLSYHFYGYQIKVNMKEWLLKMIQWQLHCTLGHEQEPASSKGL